MIYTLTLNPSIDVTLTCDGLHGERLNTVLSETRQAGGKGVNVSTVIKNFALPVCSVLLCPEKGREEFLNLLGDSAGKTVSFDFDGKVRENLTIITDDECVKLNRKGDVCSKEAFSSLCEYILKNAAAGDILALCGSAAKGIDSTELKNFLNELSKRNIKLFLDSSSIGLSEIKALRPFVIKPNIHELCDMFSLDEIPPAEKIYELLFEIHGYGVQNILLSQGGDGMLALCGGEIYKINVPRVAVKSTVGAGDSTLAGFAVGTAKNMNTEDVLKLACACGTATVTKEGTKLCDKETTEKYIDKISVEILNTKENI